jgi:hypothetical protein
MLKKLLALLEKAGEQRRQGFADKVESFNDQLAHEIEWGSVSGFHIGYRNRKLKKTGNGSVFFQPSIMAVLFPLVFVLMGGYIVWVSSMLKPSIQSVLIYPVSTFQHYVHLFPRIVETGRIWGQLFGLVFFVIGLVYLYFSVRPIKFSRVDNSYSKGFWTTKKIPFHKIHAIQVVWDTGETDSPTVYEINLVLKNKERLFVFGHPQEEVVRTDAVELARMLGVPLWDITSYSKESSTLTHLTESFKEKFKLEKPERTQKKRHLVTWSNGLVMSVIMTICAVIGFQSTDMSNNRILTCDKAQDKCVYEKQGIFSSQKTISLESLKSARVSQYTTKEKGVYYTYTTLVFDTKNGSWAPFSSDKPEVVNSMVDDFNQFLSTDSNGNKWNNSVQLVEDRYLFRLILFGVLIAAFLLHWGSLAQKKRGEFIRAMGSYIYEYVVIIALLGGVYYFVVGSPVISHYDKETELQIDTSMVDISRKPNPPTTMLHTDQKESPPQNAEKFNLKPYRYKCIKVLLKSDQALLGYVVEIINSEALVLQVIGGVVRVNSSEIASVEKLPMDDSQFESAISETGFYRTLSDIRSELANVIPISDYSNPEPSSSIYVVWTSSLKRSMRVARILEKHTLLHFYLPGKENRNPHHRDIFEDESIRLILDRNFALTSIHSSEKEIINDFWVTRFPTYVFLDSSGNMILSKSGNVTKPEFMALISQILKNE